MESFTEKLKFKNYLLITLLLACSALLTFSQDNNPLKLTIIFIKEKDQNYLSEWLNEVLKNNGKLDLNVVQLELNENDGDNQLICDTVSQGGSAIIDLSWTENVKLAKIAENLNIPFIHIDISISPYLALLDGYLHYRNSTDVSLIFDDSERVDQALYYWIESTLLRMIITENFDKTVADRLRTIKPIPNNFVIVAKTVNMTELFKMVLAEDIVKLPIRWNLLFLDFQENNFDRKLLNAMPINLLYLDEKLCCELLLNGGACQCPDDFNLPKAFFNYVIGIFVRIIQMMADEKLEFTAGLKCNSTRFNEQSKKKFDDLIDEEVKKSPLIYKHGHILRVNSFGTVEIGSQDSSNDVKNEVAKFTRSTGIQVLDGKVIPYNKPFYRVGIAYALPWSYKETDASGKTYWTGYCVDFTEKLAEAINFDFEFVEPKSGSFGEKVNGIWDGVIGDLAAGETDLAVTALTMTADREEVVDFVAPYFEQTGITIVMRKPVRKTSLFKFMTVLKLEVWLCIVGALIVTGLMVWFLDKYSPYSARNNKKAYPYPCREFTLKESFWFALTSFTPQGGGEAPKALSGRTLVAAYWLFVVLMLATFTANLAAFLTVERMQTPVQSLEQLSKQSRINYTVVESSSTHVYFINMKYAEDTLYRLWKELTLNASTDETQYRVWDYPIREQYGHILLAINDSNPVANASEGFRIVNERLEADFAFIHDSAEIKYEISRNCNLTEVGEVFAERPYAVAVQQGSHLQDDITTAIINLQKNRVFEQLNAKYWNHSAKGDCPSTDDNEGITLESLGGVFIATLFGLALAMITLVGEIFYYRRKRKLGSSDKDKDSAQARTPQNQFEKNPITIGTEFKPVNFKNKNVSELAHITLYPRARNPITRIN